MTHACSTGTKPSAENNWSRFSSCRRLKKPCWKNLFFLFENNCFSTVNSDITQVKMARVVPTLRSQHALFLVYAAVPDKCHHFHLKMALAWSTVCLIIGCLMIGNQNPVRKPTISEPENYHKQFCS